MLTSAPDARRASHSPLPLEFARIKMASRDVEPFPPLQTEQPKKESRSLGKSGSVRRRKSSGLGAELPGDTSVPAFATLGSPPATPIEPTVCVAVGMDKLRC